MEMDETEMRPTSTEIRERIIKCYQQGTFTIQELTDLFEVSERSIYRYLSLSRQRLSLIPKSQPGRPPVLTKENLQLIKNIFSSKNDGTLQEYADIFEKKTGIQVSYVTVHNACKKLNFRFKKKVFTHKNKIG